MFAVSLSLGNAASAAPAEREPVRVEVFTARDLPIQAVGREDSPATLTNIEVHEVDGIERFEAILSEQLPRGLEAATRLAQERLGQSDVSRPNDAHRAAIGLLKAAEYGIDRYPAIVFDGQAVVYGVTDVGKALHLYENRRSGMPR